MKKTYTLRGKILSLLREFYADKLMDEQSIISTVYEYHKVEEVEQSLEYLTDKGYLLREEKPHPTRTGEKVRRYKITPDGIDVQEGTKDDPGIIRVNW